MHESDSSPITHELVARQARRAVLLNPQVRNWESIIARVVSRYLLREQSVVADLVEDEEGNSQ